jgi:hypothetical protein
LSVWEDGYFSFATRTRYGSGGQNAIWNIYESNIVLITYTTLLCIGVTYDD